MKVSKPTATIALSVVTALLMALMMATDGGIVFFLLMVVWVLVVGGRIALSAHHDNVSDYSHTSLSHIVLAKPEKQSPDGHTQKPKSQ